MNDSPENSWNPDPQLLAAFFDGELDDRPEYGDLRRRVKLWLENHPSALAEGEKYQHLRKLWQETTPPEPSTAAWSRTYDQIEASVHQPQHNALAHPNGSARPSPSARPSASPRRPWAAATACTVALVVLSGLLFGMLRWSSTFSWQENPSNLVQEKPKTGANEEPEVLPVAQAGEVLILRVEGEDTAALVVGELPLHGPMELADPGEIEVFHVRPDLRDQMLPQVRQEGLNRPMIWARSDTDND